MWSVWIAASLSMWMSDVAAAWLMTSLSDAPVMVALVQTAATLPIFLIGLASGAMADIVDRRRLLIITQVWSGLVASVLFVTTLAGVLGPQLLLVLVFANGVVLALRWPVFSATVPELVPRSSLAEAMALNGVANNGSRIIGPLVAGAIIAAAGSAWVFAVNAVLAVAATALLLRWRYDPKKSALPNERFVGAIRVGLQHVRQSRPMQFVLLRAAVFYLFSIALIALLPLVARQIDAGDAGTFTLLLASMGAGAVTGAMLLPMASRRLQHDARFTLASLLFALGSVAVAVSPTLYAAMPAMVLVGIAFMLAANTLMVSAQLALPDWVRARGLSIYQMVMMGSAAFGAALWGWVASTTSVSTSIGVAALAAAAGLFATRNAHIGTSVMADLSLGPQRPWTIPDPTIPVALDEGPVLVTVEYRIDPGRADEFAAVMRESRRVWLGNGLTAWSLFSDVAEPGRYIEHMVDESWAAYVRRNERVAESYLALRERKHSFHLGPMPPAVTRYIAEGV